MTTPSRISCPGDTTQTSEVRDPELKRSTNKVGGGGGGGGGVKVKRRGTVEVEDVTISTASISFVSSAKREFAHDFCAIPSCFND